MNFRDLKRSQLRKSLENEKRFSDRLEIAERMIFTAMDMASDALKRPTHVHIVVTGEPAYTGTIEKVVQEMGQRIVQLKWEAK